jgi:hypothetical protein
MNCIQCKWNAAVFEELGNAKNMYCGHTCQQKYHQRRRLIGVRNGKREEDKDIINLISSDGIIFPITAAQARKMKTIGDMLEDVDTEEGITLHNVDRSTL